MRVLLVSTNPDVTRQVRTALLSSPEADVSLVATPQRALQQLEEAGPFDLVIADNDTHPAGGFFLARDVKARAQMGERMPPVLLLLGRHQDTWLADWSGADAWVIKPVDLFDLAEVAGALAGGGAVPALPGVGARRTGAPEVAAGEAS